MFIRTAESQARLESLAEQMEESAQLKDEYNNIIQARESVLQQVKDRVLSMRMISTQSSETLANLLNTLISTVQSIEEVKRSREAEIVKYNSLRKAMASENGFMINP